MGAGRCLTLGPTGPGGRIPRVTRPQHSLPPAPPKGLARSPRPIRRPLGGAPGHAPSRPWPQDRLSKVPSLGGAPRRGSPPTREDGRKKGPQLPAPPSGKSWPRPLGRDQPNNAKHSPGASPWQRAPVARRPGAVVNRVRGVTHPGRGGDGELAGTRPGSRTQTAAEGGGGGSRGSRNRRDEGGSPGTEMGWPRRACPRPRPERPSRGHWRWARSPAPPRVPRAQGPAGPRTP